MLVMLNVQTNGIRVIQGSMKDLRLSNNFKHSYRMSAYYQCFLNHILLSVRCKASVSLPT